MNFSELKLHPALKCAIESKGYAEPTPIQQQAIPPILEGRDMLGCAQTGTGKTDAYAIPILHRFLVASKPKRPRPIRALVLAPTRELAAQIDASFQSLCSKIRVFHTVVYGGVSQVPQTRALDRGVDILIATPGRLLDLMNQGFVDLSRVEILVLDEADRMLDMGFLPDIRRVMKAIPEQRQTLLFSATLPASIRELAEDILNQPEQVTIAPPASTVDSVEQRVFFVERPEKLTLLIKLFNRPEVTRALVFTRTKHGADKIALRLEKEAITAVSIHGDKSQNNRERALAEFKRGSKRVLVATDIAARGLDIHKVSHVVNFDLPDDPESYVHRIGRTGRAGAGGVALSFCGRDERGNLGSIERLIRKRIAVARNTDFRSQA